MRSSNSKHQIDLSRQWEILDPEATVAQGPSGGNSRPRRINLFDLDPAAAEIRLLRKFNCPTGLAAKTEITLCLQNFPDHTQISLNGAAIELTACDQSQHFYSEVTGSLKPFNQLELVVAPQFNNGQNQELRVLLELSDG